MLIAISFYKVASIIPTHGLGTSTENIGVGVKGDILIIGRKSMLLNLDFTRRTFSSRSYARFPK